MFTTTSTEDLKSRFETFTHCWIKFRSSNDTFAAKIASLKFDDDSLTISTSKMSRCIELVKDELGTKKWFPIHHHTNYPIANINLAKIKKAYTKMSSLQRNNPTLSFYVHNGDEVTFTSDPVAINEIEEILNNKAL